jgi:hypothetical protein
MYIRTALGTNNVKIERGRKSEDVLDVWFALVTPRVGLTQKHFLLNHV